MADVIARQFLVRGRVQGVGFRWHTADAAIHAGATGWVRNLPDGRVEVLVEGAQEAVRAVEDAVRRGPAGARVTHVQTVPVSVSGTYDSFQVIR